MRSTGEPSVLVVGGVQDSTAVPEPAVKLEESDPPPPQLTRAADESERNKRNEKLVPFNFFMT
jgi:hypothetical protein